MKVSTENVHGTSVDPSISLDAGPEPLWAKVRVPYHRVSRLGG